MAERASAMTGLEKASVLLMCLGPEKSALVVDRLTPREQDMIGAEILRLRRVDPMTRLAVLDEVRALVCSSARPAMGSGGLREAFRWLDEVEPREVARALSDGDPACAAVALLGLSAKHAEAVMSCLSSSLQDSVAERMEKMGPVSGEAVEAIERSIRLRLAQPEPEASNARPFAGLWGVLLSALRSPLSTLRSSHSGGRV